MSHIAMCSACHEEPLVMTFFFRGKEFICLKCGRLYEFFGPEAANETKTRLAKMESRKAEWAEHAPALICRGMWKKGCEKCQASGREEHWLHATPSEKAVSETSLMWLSERTGRTLTAKDGVLA